jgi:hypothetical protein
VLKPVTVVAEVAVNSASRNGVDLPLWVAIGRLRSRVPDIMIAVNAIAIS